VRRSATEIPILHELGEASMARAKKAVGKKAVAAKVRTGFTNVTFDARPDRLDFRDKAYLPPLRSLAPRFPDDATIARFLPAYVKAGLVLDQGREGACTGFGLACVINFLTFVRSLGSTPRGEFRPASPRMLYELARRYDEWRGENYEGSSCRGALKGWHKHGVCAEDLWPYRDKAGKVRLMIPDAAWAADAVTRPLGVYYRIDKRSVVDVQAAIQQIGAVYVSARVHDGWDRVPEGPAPKSHDEVPVIGPAVNPKNSGGHAFALIGYNEHGFIVQNSWGSGWGAGGFAVMPYRDWVSSATDAWAVALGVPQQLTPERIESVRWPSRSGRSLGFFDLALRNPRNPADDPWPIDRDYEYAPYEPWSTAQAYGHTLVTGNDGRIVVTDLTAGGGQDNIGRFLDELLVQRPLAWMKDTGSRKLMLYAHGGLNSEADSIDRLRVLAPYFEANGIYPLFLTWRTGPGETVSAVLEDVFRSFFGAEDEEEMRAAGFFDELAEARDRRVEELAQRTVKPLWTEMRENAARSSDHGHGLDQLATYLARMQDKLKAGALELHLVGHSAGSILLGHLLPLLAAGGAPVRVSSCTLFAAACSVQFAVDKYLKKGAKVLKSSDLHLHYLSDRNEKDDFLGGVRAAGLHLYGKSLLYLVSRALDDARKIPLLGLQRAVETDWHGGDVRWQRDQWAPEHLGYIDQWLAGFKGHLHRIDAPSVQINKRGKTAQAQHGAFDNDLKTIGETIERIRGAPLVSPIEWLDYY
jgi:hypothetical protein